MDKAIELFRDNMKFMADEIEKHAAIFRKLEETFTQYPDEAYLMISEKEKIILFSGFVNLDKQLRAIQADKIEALLKRLTEKLYGLRGGKNGYIRRK